MLDAVARPQTSPGRPQTSPAPQTLSAPSAFCGDPVDERPIRAIPTRSVSDGFPRKKRKKNTDEKGPHPHGNCSAVLNLDP